MNMQKTVNFDAVRYFRFLFPSTFLPRSMCIGINIFSLRKRAERIFNRRVIRFVRLGFFLLGPKMKADSRRNEIETFFIDYKGRMGEGVDSENFDEKKGTRGR